jgi:hypothetical protein
MTPEQEKKLRWKYTNNPLELMAHQPKLFWDKEEKPVSTHPPPGTREAGI